MKLKEIKIEPSSYAEEFFREVSKAAEGKFFLYEGPTTTVNNVRSSAYSFGRSLGVKFTVRTVKPEGSDTEQIVVGTTTKTRAPRGSRKNLGALPEPEVAPESQSPVTFYQSPAIPVEISGPVTEAH